MRILALLLFTACATVPMPPHQKPDPIAEKAVEAFRDGAERFAERRWDQALTAFETARELKWSPLTDVAIARTLDQMDRETMACRYWVELADTRELVDDAKRGSATAVEALKEVGARSTECLTRGLGFTYPTAGPPDALVTIVEFSSFQCPFCKRVQATLKQVAAHYEGQVRFVFMHRPLPFHKQSEPAARAAAAAHRQGRFWEMHDKIFENYRALNAEFYAKAAGEIDGMDVEKFKADMDSPKTQALIVEEMKEAGTVGVRGTPTFFINGKKPTGRSFEQWKTIITAEIEKKG